MKNRCAPVSVSSPKIAPFSLGTSHPGPLAYAIRQRTKTKDNDLRRKMQGLDILE
jgi:hypothetical protein